MKTLQFLIIGTIMLLVCLAVKAVGYLDAYFAAIVITVLFDINRGVREKEKP